MTWTEAYSKIVDTLLNIISTNKDIEQDELLHHFHTEFTELASEEHLEQLWKRMQAFPHCFEVAHARNDVDSLDLQGNEIPDESQNNTRKAASVK